VTAQGTGDRQGKSMFFLLDREVIQLGGNNI
jgi:hypothetical protein